MTIGLAMFISDTSIGVSTLVQKAEESGFESLWVPQHSLAAIRADHSWGVGYAILRQA